MRRRGLSQNRAQGGPTLRRLGRGLRRVVRVRAAAAHRQAQGLTQDELGTTVGISNRIIAYHERDGAQPPGAILVELARVLHVSPDALLGVTPLRERRSPKTARLLKRLQKIDDLPAAD